MNGMSITSYTWIPPYNKIDNQSVEQWLQEDEKQFIDLIHKESYNPYYRGYFYYVGRKNWSVPNSKFYKLAFKILKNDKTDLEDISEENIIEEAFALYVSDYILKRFLKILKFLAYRHMMFVYNVMSISFDFDHILERRLKQLSVSDTPADFKKMIVSILEDYKHKISI